MNDQRRRARLLAVMMMETENLGRYFRILPKGISSGLILMLVSAGYALQSRSAPSSVMQGTVKVKVAAVSIPRGWEADPVTELNAYVFALRKGGRRMVTVAYSRKLSRLPNKSTDEKTAKNIAKFDSRFKVIRYVRSVQAGPSLLHLSCYQVTEGGKREVAGYIVQGQHRLSLIMTVFSSASLDQAVSQILPLIKSTRLIP